MSAPRPGVAKPELSTEARRRSGALFFLVLVGSLGCATTTIHPVKRAPEEAVYVKNKQCLVRDFPAATDLPPGAKNLGWVSVKSTGDDEATFVALRKQICELGGDALSQAAWVRDFSDEEAELKANAWVLP